MDEIAAVMRHFAGGRQPLTAPPHPALAFRVTLPSRRRVSYTVTRRARVRLQVLGEGRTLQLRTTTGPGTDRFRLPRTLPSGGYELRLTAVTDTGVRLTRAHRHAPGQEPSGPGREGSRDLLR